MPMPKFSEPDHVAYSLPLEPPFFFRGMTARVFPLRGSLLAMQRFADAYVNVIPRELGWYRAITPYAFLMMVDYGSLAPDKANLGWLSQREIMFTFPVEEYRLVDGQYVFKDWAWLTPYIFVDSALSMTLGRTVYGWPKELVQIGPTADEWLQDPDNPLQAARVNAAVFPELYAGKKQELRPFLDVERKPRATAFQMPIRQDNPFFPWAVWANLFSDATRLSADAFAILGSMGFLRPVQGPTPANRQRMMSAAARSMMPDGPPPAFRTLNLKQFRASENPSRYCYQSLTDASMIMKKVNRFGLAGDFSTFAGDSSGGLGITLHRWASLPIIETLGLETAREWRGDGVDMAYLQPVMPFWYDVDMLYERGVNIAWRTFDARWHDQEGRVYEPLAEEGDFADQYNGTLGASTQTVAGPFVYKDAAVRVLPLLAKRDHLRCFIDSYFNEALRGSGFEFELWTSDADNAEGGPAGPGFAYVYLAATSFGSMISETNNIGSWANTELQFSVPVRWKNTDTGEWGVGLVPVFSFVDRTTAAISASEVTGIPTTPAQFEMPDVNWMTVSGIGRHALQPLLRVNTGVIPAFGQNTEAVFRTIVEITKEPGSTRLAAADWRAVADGWGHVLRDETCRKKSQHEAAKRKITAAGGDRADGLVMALAALAGELPIRSFTLKQYRDVKESDRACYQSLVGISRWIENLRNLCEIEAPLGLSIHEYPSQPIVELLGLVTKLSGRQQGGGVIHELEPIRPFWFRADIREDLGERMAHRTTEHWQVGRSAPAAGARPPRGWPSLSPTLQAIIDGGAPRRLLGITRDWADEPQHLTSPVTPERARAASRLLEPQTVLEIVLAREWEHWGEEARWSRRRRQLQSQLDDVRARHTSEGLMEAQLRLFAKLIEGVGAWDFRDKLVAVARTRLALLERTSEGRRDMERAYDDLVRAIRVRPVAARPAPEAPGAPPTESPPSAAPPSRTDAIERMRSAVERICKGVEIDDDHRQYFVPDLRRLQKLDAARIRVFPEAPLLPDFLSTLLPGLGSLSLELLASPYLQYEQDPTPLGHLFAMVRDEEKAQIDALLDWLSKEAQKPDFCLPRESVGPEKARMFPLATSWDDTWYAPPFESRPRTKEPR